MLGHDGAAEGGRGPAPAPPPQPRACAFGDAWRRGRGGGASPGEAGRRSRARGGAEAEGRGGEPAGDPAALGPGGRRGRAGAVLAARGARGSQALWRRWRAARPAVGAVGAVGAARAPRRALAGALRAAPVACRPLPSLPLLLPPGPARLRSARRCDWAEDGAGRMEILMTVSKIASICTMVSEGPGRPSPALPAAGGGDAGRWKGAVGRRGRLGLRGAPGGGWCSGVGTGRRGDVRGRGSGSAAVGGDRQRSRVNRLWETQP